LLQFVVDNEWLTDPDAPQEKDSEGNLNNLLLPEDMSKPEDTGPAAAILNTVTPESTTAQLAGAVPLESARDEAAVILNTVTPESTTAQLAGAVPLESAKDKAAEPTAALLDTVTPESTTVALAGAVSIEETKNQVTAPGGYPETPATELDKELKVSPLPAAEGAVNPIQLAPGENIPDEVKAGDIKDNVTLDKESYEQSDRIPGAATIAAAATAGEVSINPLPAADGALNPIKLEPGEKIPDEISTGKITDNVTLDKESYGQSDRLPGSSVATDLEKEVKVNPLPAAEGALNPIKLEPGEKIPDEISTGNITDNVTLDKDSYEKSDRLPGSNAASDLKKEVKVNPLPATEGALNPIKLAPGEKIPKDVTTGSVTDNVTLDKESYEKSDRIPGLETQLPPISSNMIPESSLPILGAGDATINTVTPQSTTAALAGQVPLEEPKVPEIVKKSQEAAKVDPEASAISEEVKEKAIVEEELLKIVPEAPSTAEGTAGKGTQKREGDKTLTETVAAAAATAGAAVFGAAVAAAVGVKDSAAAATEAAAKLPEAAKEVLPVSLQETVAAVAAVPEEAKPPAVEAAAEAPTPVKQSIAASGESPEAAANAVAIEEKKEVEAELLKKVEEVKPAGEGASAEVEEPKVGEPKVEKTPEPTAVEEIKPTIRAVETNGETNGAKVVASEAHVPTAPATAATPTTTETAEPTKPSDAAATVEKKKRNRLSAILSKLKHKVSGDRK